MMPAQGRRDPPWSPTRLPEPLVGAASPVSYLPILESLPKAVSFHNRSWTSLLAQSLRICLPMQGHRFDPWFGKIPRAAGQLSRCARTAEPEP